MSRVYVPNTMCQFYLNTMGAGRRETAVPSAGDILHPSQTNMDIPTN